MVHESIVRRRAEILRNGSERFFGGSNRLMEKHLTRFASPLKRALTVDNGIGASDEGVR